MSTEKPSTLATQIEMPGMPGSERGGNFAEAANLAPGQIVRYSGHVWGGPRFGAHGRVVRALHRKAVVDLGPSGRWHIPYHFLKIGEAA